MKAADNKQKLYMYDYFNVTAFTPNPLSINRSPMARIYNALAQGLNEATKLPRVILMIIQDDLLNAINYTIGRKSHAIGTCWDWLIKNIERAIDIKKEDLRNKKPGAVRINEPKIIWVKMFGSSEANLPQALLAAKDISNFILEEILSTKHNHFVLDISGELMDTQFYRINGELNGTGMVHFWCSIDTMISKFDKYEISL